MTIPSITPERLAASVISVPPLARNADWSINAEQNRRMVQYLASGGVTTFLYGGNAILHHVALSEYEQLLNMLTELDGPETAMIPSVGPGFGMLMDQAAMLRGTQFATAMILPTRDMVTSDGVATAVRRFVERITRPAVLYIKNDGFVDVAAVRRLMDDGLLSWIKYAIVRDNTANDSYLRELIDAVGPSRIVSGIGEQPALTHLRDFGVISFTSGCVCVAPALSMQMLKAMQANDWNKADGIRRVFEPLENLRNQINPVRVLHTAVRRAGIADTGPLIPLLCELSSEQCDAVATAAAQLMAANGN